MKSNRNKKFITFSIVRWFVMVWTWPYDTCRARSSTSEYLFWRASGTGLTPERPHGLVSTALTPQVRSPLTNSSTLYSGLNIITCCFPCERISLVYDRSLIFYTHKCAPFFRISAVCPTYSDRKWGGRDTNSPKIQSLIFSESLNLVNSSIPVSL